MIFLWSLCLPVFRGTIDIYWWHEKSRNSCDFCATLQLAPEHLKKSVPGRCFTTVAFWLFSRGLYESFQFIEHQVGLRLGSLMNVLRGATGWGLGVCMNEHGTRMSKWNQFKRSHLQPTCFYNKYSPPALFLRDLDPMSLSMIILDPIFWKIFLQILPLPGHGRLHDSVLWARLCGGWQRFHCLGYLSWTKKKESWVGWG